MLDVKLETLLVVADCGNFTKAAEILSLTQPAVSHHINQLEKECGARLFLRGKGDFKLTQEGKIAVTYGAGSRPCTRRCFKRSQMSKSIFPGFGSESPIPLKITPSRRCWQNMRAKIPM